MESARHQAVLFESCLEKCWLNALPNSKQRRTNHVDDVARPIRHIPKAEGAQPKQIPVKVKEVSGTRLGRRGGGHWSPPHVRDF
jgi:hypothetical protein